MAATTRQNLSCIRGPHLSFVLPPQSNLDDRIFVPAHQILVDQSTGRVPLLQTYAFSTQEKSKRVQDDSATVWTLEPGS